ncbi:gamma-glutamyltransferase family protein [Thermoplasma sp.]|uniref:gamma-glutamyltransferase family protein n=1 Tax=Thermoplasma sp. TaxID=1973142 RepID=UPI0012794002|nr:gamma-glutamyltransferase family protein [Thermoplasma sp.]KAA8923045.1 MAG: gamma-glutamyltransferase family protein [Thermoplasma sp.]
MVRSRPNAFSERSVIASSNELASLAGRDIMKMGGNLFDAALAVSAMLCVTQNNLCGLGGDLFALIRDEDGHIVDLNGSGQSSMSVSIDLYESMGLTKIPERGPYAAITVPGIAGAWEEIFRRFATLDISDILDPAIKAAKHGFPLTQNYSESIGRSVPAIGSYAGWSSIFMPGGRVPAAGEVLRQPDLARSLQLLSEEGYRSFYEGSLSDLIISGLDGSGSPIGRDDLHRYRPLIGDPVYTDIDRFRIYETSPNSQGITVIEWTDGLVSHGYDSQSLERAKPEDLFEAMEEAYRMRRNITDPAYMLGHDGSTGIQKTGNLPKHTRGDSGDTTYFSISDSEGRSVSIIQSNYMGFGSGIVPRGTGFVIQNRGSYFTLERKHPNALMPGKRTFHTLAACMIEKDGEFYASLGSMGGDIQPQVQMQIISGILKDNTDPQMIIDRPRWAEPYTIYEDPGAIYVESEDLAGRISGHVGSRKVILREISQEFGTAQITAMTDKGIIVGSADPRGDGVAIPVS